MNLRIAFAGVVLALAVLCEVQQPALAVSDSRNPAHTGDTDDRRFAVYCDAGTAVCFSGTTYTKGICAGDLNWQQAEDACVSRGDGEHLPSVHSLGEHLSIVASKLLAHCPAEAQFPDGYEDDAWIGLTCGDTGPDDDPHAACWRWSDGSPYQSEPQFWNEDNPGSSDACVEVDGADQDRWDTESCTSDRREVLVCQGRQVEEAVGDGEKYTNMKSMGWNPFHN